MASTPASIDISGNEQKPNGWVSPWISAEPGADHPDDRELSVRPDLESDARMPVRRARPEAAGFEPVGKRLNAPFTSGVPQANVGDTNGVGDDSQRGFTALAETKKEASTT